VIHPAPGGVFIDVRVVPRSGRSTIAGSRDGALLVRLTAPPVEGAANAELIAILAEALGVPKRSVTIASGEHSKRKRIEVTGISERQIREKLGLL
jgi:uncharacterized protein (TIGR00251 family)